MADLEFQNTDSGQQSLENRIVNTALTKLPPPVVSGPRLGADVSICDADGNTVLTLNTTAKLNPSLASVKDDYVVWVLTDLEGWWNMPEPEMPELSRGWGDGSYDAIGRHTARIINLSGVFLTMDPKYVEAARAKLIAAFNLVYKGGWLVVNETPAKASFIRLSGKPEIATTTARGRTEFTIGLKAVDPIKYEWLTTGADVSEGYRFVDVVASVSKTITNAGNTKVPVIIEIAGPTTGTKTITRNATTNFEAETINIYENIPSGSKLIIDTLNREVLLENTSTGVITNARHYMGTMSDWIYLHPSPEISGGTSTFASTVNCRIFYRSGWIA